MNFASRAGLLALPLLLTLGFAAQ
ncbi:MAG: hypothetical protein QOH67_1131, partial [Hyphomicrobiales bacterium]|nr:hypothetical protein [Hyphomicrobiales bacterium]